MTTPTDPILLPTDVLEDQRLRSSKEDLFRVGAIAGRVAELLAGSAHPVHVGVFGAWGIGKSSFLQLVDDNLVGLAGKKVGGYQYPKKFEIVRYDAWRYGGPALRRDLIAVAARKLRIRRHRYTDGLFESRQVVRIEVNELVRRFVAFMLGVAALAGALALLCSTVWALIWLASQIWSGVNSPSELLDDVKIQWGKVTAVVTGVLAVLNAPSLLGVSVNRSLPSQDDEFARNLRELIREAELPKPLRPMSRLPLVGPGLRKFFNRKIIFFIDELDRATDKEVLDTLTALQTQFASAQVSVVVAADRDVLESALTTGERQSGPDREWDPYLSSSDAFLDKVFQHTFTLPPLRSERIATFARDLVEEQPGLWTDIKNAGLLDDVLYVLLPSHVTGPRRIKVLLNAYATQTRVAEARNLVVTGMRRELALWVVLQAEFPSFAGDLRVDPRLRHALLANESGIGKRARMLARHKELPQPDDGAPADAWMVWTKRSQLSDYLERTQHVADVPFDLLFLEAAGSAIGFFTEEIAEVLDRADEATPAETLRLLAGLDAETRDRAIWHLAENSRRAISVGRDKVVAAMAGLIEQHDASPITRPEAALEAFRPYRPGDVPDEALVGQVRATLEASSATLKTVLADADSRDEFANRAVLVERLTFPTDLDDTARGALATWWGPAMSAQLLRMLVDKYEWRLISDAAAAHPADVLRILKMPYDVEPDTDDDATATEEVAATTASTTGAVVEADDPDETDVDDDGSNDPSWIDATVVDDILSELTARASGALASALAVEGLDEDETPPLAEHIADAGQLADADHARLAASMIAADPNADLGRWSASAALCDDQALLTVAFERIVARLVCGADADDVEAVLNLCAELTFRLGDDAVFSSIKTHLQDEPWDDDPDGRAELGTAVVRRLEQLDAERAENLAHTDISGALVPLTEGLLRPAQALALHDLLSIELLKSIDDLLAADAADDPARSRRLEARLWLRRNSDNKLVRIQADAVGRLVRGVDADDEAGITARDHLAHEFFAKGPTEREVSKFLTTGRLAFYSEMVTWMKATTPVPATNIWLQVVKAAYPDTTIRILANARPLESGRLADYLGGLATSDDVATRKRAVALLRMFPSSRSDVGPAVQAVAAGINKRTADETRSAVRLLVDYDPRSLTGESKTIIRDAPGYAFARKADKAFRKLVGRRGEGLDVRQG